MRNFYFDLAKICFGVGFYGAVSKIQNLYIAIIIAIISLVMCLIFAIIAYNRKKED